MCRFGFTHAVQLRTIHLWAGIGGIVVFLGTGQYLKYGFPGLYEGHEVVRYMFRANHVYILLASLVNVLAGCYLTLNRKGWRRKLAITGSMFLLIAPVVLLVAFFIEAPRGVPERMLTLLGIHLVLIGALLQFPNRATSK